MIGLDPVQAAGSIVGIGVLVSGIVLEVEGFQPSPKTFIFVLISSTETRFFSGLLSLPILV